MFKFTMTASAALAQLSREHEVQMGQMWLMGTEPRNTRMGKGSFSGKPNRNLSRLAGLMGLRGLSVYKLNSSGESLVGFNYNARGGCAGEWAEQIVADLEHVDGYVYVSKAGYMTVAIWAESASISKICKLIDLWADNQEDNQVLLPEPIELMTCADRRDAYMTAVAAEYEAQLARRYPAWYRKQCALHHKRWERAHGR